MELCLSTVGPNKVYWSCYIDAESLMAARDPKALLGLVKYHFDTGVRMLREREPKRNAPHDFYAAQGRPEGRYPRADRFIMDDVRWNVADKENPTRPVVPKEWGEEAP